MWHRGAADAGAAGHYARGGWTGIGDTIVADVVFAHMEELGVMRVPCLAVWNVVSRRAGA